MLGFIRRERLFAYTLSDNKSNQPSSSKTEQAPSTIKERIARKLLPSDDETTSNSSGADFEPVQKRFSTPRRQLRSSAEKRQTRSSAKMLEEITEEACDVTTSSVGDGGEEKECDDPNNPFEPSIISATLPDPPSPSLLDDLHEKESNHSDAVSSKKLTNILATGFYTREKDRET